MQRTIQYIKSELTGLYQPNEIESFTRIIVESICGLNFTQQLLKKNDKIAEPDFEKIEAIVARLKQFEPVQYILGETVFSSLLLYVNSSVLIPRFETEELVQWILQSQLPKNCSILDIGTGSGCIALALKNNLKEAQVFAVDISAGAIETAKRNANTNKLNITFFEADILQWEKFVWGKYDIIVSNPPYIRESEKREMLQNVLEYEPDSALFVPDADPLVFYSAIAAFAKSNLAKKGRLFFEINENLGSQTVDMLANAGFSKIELRKDINGKNRMIGCSFHK